MDINNTNYIANVKKLVDALVIPKYNFVGGYDVNLKTDIGLYSSSGLYFDVEVIDSDILSVYSPNYLDVKYFKQDVSDALKYISGYVDCYFNFKVRDEEI